MRYEYYIAIHAIQISYLYLYIVLNFILVLRMTLCLHSGLDPDSAASLPGFNLGSGSSAGEYAAIPRYFLHLLQVSYLFQFFPFFALCP